MHTLIIQDLSASIELDRKAMRAVHGGAGDQAIGTSQANGQLMTSAANIGNASLFGGGPATIQSDNAFSQSAYNSNYAVNVDAYLGFGGFGPIPVF